MVTEPAATPDRLTAHATAAAILRPIGWALIAGAVVMWVAQFFVTVSLSPFGFDDRIGDFALAALPLPLGLAVVGGVLLGAASEARLRSAEERD